MREKFAAEREEYYRKEEEKEKYRLVHTYAPTAAPTLDDFTQQLENGDTRITQTSFNAY